MALYETLVAVFDTPEHAEAAVDALKAGGFHNDDISIFDKDRVPGRLAKDVKEAGLWNRLFGSGLYKHEAAVFGQTVDQGGTVLSLRALDSEVAHATGILDLHHPVDIQDRAVTSAIAPAATVAAAAKTITNVPAAVAQKIAVTPEIAKTHGEVLRLAEEQLQVGKKNVETGRTRVRRFTTERDVSADVTLHEEHANVLRRAVSDPVKVNELDWSDRSLEVVETAEQALVNKTARVVEEIDLDKIGTDHIETVHEKLRRQQAEVERVDATGKRIGN
jgi:stress response protein YsnF